MKNNTTILTFSQTAEILDINENALNALVYGGQIPYLRTSAADAQQIKFNMAAINNWLSFGPTLNMDNQDITRMKERLPEKYPQAYAALHEYNKQFITPRKPKGYSLSTVSNKKLVFVYYVRYIDKGQLVRSRWSTHTNNLEAAKRFAVENRNRLLTAYYQKRAGQKPSGSLYTIMKKYYEKDSPYQKSDARRGRMLGDQSRISYHNAIMYHWIPFLKKRRIASLHEIDTPLMARFQDYCMDKGIKPQSVNHYVSFVSRIFENLVIRGQLTANPCSGLTPLRVKEQDVTLRNCYDLKTMRGVFNKRWDDELSYILCLMIYSTGMRNSELDRIQEKDIVRINQCRFINIPKSKTRYGARMVPLHDFVYGKLMRYIHKHNKGPDDLLFCQPNGKALSRQRYTNANVDLGAFTHYDKARLEKEHITYYSGRHFYKTMMNAGELGDIEEYFMGHKISNDVAKRYNHRDKQGQDKIVRRARDVFRILDKTLFIQR